MAIPAVAIAAIQAAISIKSGLDQSASLVEQSKQAKLNARFEKIKGRDQALQIKEQLENDLASQNAIFASRGSLSGEGSALAALNVSKANATRDIDIARFNTEINVQNANSRAANLRGQASASLLKGISGAFGSIGSAQRSGAFQGTRRQQTSPQVEDLSISRSNNRNILRTNVKRR